MGVISRSATETLTMTTKFGQFLRRFRSLKGLNQGEIAERLGTSVSFYSSLETGKRPPSPRILEAIDELLDMSTKDSDYMHQAASEAIEQIRLNMSSANNASRDVALSFARRFDSLDADQLARIKVLLNE